MENNNYFTELNAINVNEHVEDKNGLKYLSWAWAIDETFRRYPNATYRILKFENNLPYVYDENTGYMVFTEVTIDGLTKEMWLPVMDSNNKAMLNHAYEYSTKYGKKTVEKATMFDINKTIMRCLVKNLAMFGLGLYIYAGEDLPEEEKKEQPKQLSEKEKEKEELEQRCKELGIDINEPRTKAWISQRLLEKSGKPSLDINLNLGHYLNALAVLIAGKEKQNNE